MGKPIDIVQGDDGTWTVIKADGKILVSGLATNAAAWRWYDQYIGEPVNRREAVSDWLFENSINKGL
jgi:hypothetical protein